MSNEQRRHRPQSGWGHDRPSSSSSTSVCQAAAAITHTHTHTRILKLVRVHWCSTEQTESLRKCLAMELPLSSVQQDPTRLPLTPLRKTMAYGPCSDQTDFATLASSEQTSWDWKGDAKELSLNHTLQNMELNWRTVHFCHRLAPKRQRRRKKSHVLEFWWFLFSIMMQCARNNGTCPATALCGLYLPCGAVWAGDRHPQSQISFAPSACETSCSSVGCGVILLHSRHSVRNHWLLFVRSSQVARQWFGPIPSPYIGCA